MRAQQCMHVEELDQSLHLANVCMDLTGHTESQSWWLLVSYYLSLSPHVGLVKRVNKYTKLIMRHGTYP